MRVMTKAIHTKKHITNPSIFNSIIPIAHHFFSAVAAALEPERVPKLFGSSIGVIQDKHLLKRAPNGELLVLYLIDNGAMDPDASLYNQLIKKCTEWKRLKEGKMVHEHFLRSRFSHYIVPNNTLINMYAKCECMDDARKMFDEMPERDMVSWTALITGYSQNRGAEEGLRVFCEMLRCGFMPNQFTFGSVLKAVGGLGSGGMGRQLHGVCVKCGYEENVYVGSALVDMYARCGLMDEGKIVFDKLSCKNEVSWNGLIAGYARKGEGEIAVKLFAEMKRGGFQPIHFTFSSVYAACASI